MKTDATSKKKVQPENTVSLEHDRVFDRDTGKVSNPMPKGRRLGRSGKIQLQLGEELEMPLNLKPTNVNGRTEYEQMCIGVR